MQKTHIFYAPIVLDEEFPVKGPGFSRPPEFAHLHNCFEIGFCRRGGGGIFQIGQKIYTCSTGCAVFINNQEYHILRNATPENSEWEFVNLDPAALLMGWIPPEEKMFDLERLSGSGFQNVYFDREAPELVQLTKLLLEEMKKQTLSHSCIRALVWAVFTKLSELAPETGDNVRPGSDDLCRLYPALNHISQNYHRQLDIPTLAGLCNMGVTAFRHHFKKSTGMLPLEYINEYRLKAAAALLLHSSMQVIEIAGRTGFPTLSHFNRIFKNHYKCSPGTFRKQKKQG